MGGERRPNDLRVLADEDLLEERLMEETALERRPSHGLLFLVHLRQWRDDEPSPSPLLRSSDRPRDDHNGSYPCKTAVVCQEAFHYKGAFPPSGRPVLLLPRCVVSDKRYGR
jgi:hypothetical protein